MTGMMIMMLMIMSQNSKDYPAVRSRIMEITTMAALENQIFSPLLLWGGPLDIFPFYFVLWFNDKYNRSVSLIANMFMYNRLFK